MNGNFKRERANPGDNEKSRKLLRRLENDIYNLTPHDALDLVGTLLCSLEEVGSDYGEFQSAQHVAREITKARKGIVG